MKETIGMTALMYHDVVEEGNHASGFPGAGADVYKIGRREFERHLEAIREAAGNRDVCLTFDDGGVSAYEPVAGILERYGWRGYFFVTTDCIGQPGFLNADQIHELDRRGHTIGSHSCSHPTRMSRIPWDQMLQEWRGSADRLAVIVGHEVGVASVPGGYYSRQVAEAAAGAGIRKLFTSEPTDKEQVVDGCRVIGRYVVRQGMGPEWPAGFAAGKLGPRLRQAAAWKAKQVAKAVGGGLYLRVRETILRN
jgi:peptidoglycan/xylan/chitin deacetylase (PgdA/CDA1 family)